MTGDREWLIGLNAVASALEHQAESVESLLVDRDRRDRRMRELLETAEGAGLEPQPVDRGELDRRFPDQRHQGVAALCRVSRPGSLETLLESLSESTAPLLLVLDHIEDPRNLGACLRTAEAAGVNGVIFPRDRAVGLTPSARKAASGAAERLPLAEVTNVARSLKALKDAGFWIVGAAGEAEQEHYDVDLRGPLVLVLGSEGRGMKRLVRESCDFLVRIPMAPAVESLNVSVAAGILLYEALRQRR